MFKKARIKITAFYLVIIIAIIGVFSILLFYYAAQHIRDNIEVTGDEQQNAIVENTIDQMQGAIAFADLIIIIISGFISYWLSGKTLKPIRTALEAQEQFSANASHELRTPLSVMKTNLEVFLRNEKTSAEEIKNIARSNLEEINYMSSMIENLLALARSKKIDTTIEFEEVSVSKTINSVIKRLKKEAEEKHLSLLLEEKDNSLVYGNERMLEQAFFNIINNAISYTKSGTIKINTYSIKNKVIIEVKDTGIGIAKENIDKIFEPFYKIDTSRNVRSGSVGLGLAIVKEIIKKHKGLIKIKSEVGKGTIVTVEMPKYI